MAVVAPPAFLQGGTVTHPASLFRRVLAPLVGRSEGVTSFNGGDDLKVQQQTPAVMGVQVLRGGAYVKADVLTDGGYYFVYNDGTTTLSIAPADGGNPRKDLIIARVKDATDEAIAGDTWTLEVVTGVPSSSPAEPALPVSALKLAVVNVAAGALTITSGNITDSRAKHTRYNALDIRDFGAVGDNATDNAVAIQAAASAAINLGLPLYIPGGDFRSSAAISLGPGQFIFGTSDEQSGGSTIIFTGATKGFFYELGSLGEGNITIKDIRIHGNASSLDILSFKNVAYIHLEQVCVNTVGNGACVKFDTVYNSVIKSCTLQEFKTHGIHLKDSNVWHIVDVQVQAGPGITQTAGLGGVYIEDSGWGTIIDGNLEGLNVGTHAIVLDNAHCVKITTTFIEFWNGSAIYAEGVFSEEIVIELCHLHCAVSQVVDFSPSNLAHRNICVQYNRGVMTAGQVLFDPGDTVDYTLKGNFINAGTQSTSGASAGATTVEHNNIAIVGYLELPSRPASVSIPTTNAQATIFTGSDGSPNAGEMRFGDGTGWIWAIKRKSDAAPLFQFKDDGTLFMPKGPLVLQEQVSLGYVQLPKMSGVPSGTANAVKLIAGDNGSGKVRFGLQFPTGSPVWLATEPS